MRLIPQFVPADTRMRILFHRRATDAERLVLLPLLPIRSEDHGCSPLKSCQSHSDSVRVNVGDDSVTPQWCFPSHPYSDESELASVTVSEPAPTHEVAQNRLDRFLQRAAKSLLDERVSDAVMWMQRANMWKNRWETSAEQVLTLYPEHWIIFSACSTVVADDDTAGAFAVHAWLVANNQWTRDIEHDFRNSRADAATLLALNRLLQQRPQRAVKLLEFSIDGHRRAGDLEQLAADYLLLFMCHNATANNSQATETRKVATAIVSDSLDSGRHPRRSGLVAWLLKHGQPRPWLMQK